LQKGDAYWRSQWPTQLSPRMFELFPWTDQLETGLAKVDDQHRILVGLINRLANEWVEGRAGQDIDAILDALAHYADYHFHTEEALWQKSLPADPRVDEHAAKHQAFLAEVVRWRQPGSSTRVTTDYLLAFLTGWLLQHILGDDKLLAQMVHGVRDGLSPQEARQRAQNQMTQIHSGLVEAVLTLYQRAAAQALALLQEKHQLDLAKSALHASEDRWRALLKGTGPALSALDQTVRTLIDQLPAGLAVADSDGERFIFANPWFCRMLGYTLDEVLSLCPRDIHPVKVLPLVREDFAHMPTHTVLAPIALPVQRKDGSSFVASIERVPFKLGERPCVMAIFSDITERQRAEKALDQARHHDTLTGLPNRRAFVEQLASSMARLPEQRYLAVAYFDLDGMAAINQTYGDSVGSALIVVVSQRLEAAKLPHQFLAHIGGDEFAYLFHDLAQRSDYVTEIQCLLGVIAQPMQVEGHTVAVTASVGVTIYPQRQRMDAEQLLRQADQAMYAAKQAGKNRFIQFDTTDDEQTRQRLLRLDAVRTALHQGQFVLYYQPKVQLPTGRVSGFEALIRWHHPQRGLLPPSEFIALVASSPLAIEVGNWVIETALAQLSKWVAQGLSTKVSVNVDARQLLDPDFVARLRRQLVAYPDVKTHQFQVEILETGALGNMVQVAGVVGQLQALGVECALDDFGTGYSSLTYLKQLAARTIKIDQSFVRGMLDDIEHAAIVNSVLSLARNFDRRALAEGVETEALGRTLIEFGCEYGQGYAIARPMPAADVPTWLKQWQLPQSWASSTVAPPRDIPILLAKVEHRAWMRQLRAYLADPALPAPVNEPTQCRFGKWLMRRSTAQRFQRNPLFSSLQSIHEELHRQTGPMLASKRTNPQADISADLAMLEALSQSMLEQLRTLRLSAADTGWSSSDFGEL